MKLLFENGEKAGSEFEKVFGELVSKYKYSGCLTAYSAGVRYAPVVRYSRVHLWISREHVSDFMKRAELTQVDSGSNVTVYITDDDDVFVDKRQIGGNYVVSPVQAFLDLMQLKGRGEEIAEAILEKEIMRDKR